jgi:hypothetical protein
MSIVNEIKEFLEKKSFICVSHNSSNVYIYKFKDGTVVKIIRVNTQSKK